MKDYFYFSKGQKIGIMVLLSMIVIVIIITESLPYFIKDEPKDHQQFRTEVELFRASLQDIPAKTYDTEKKPDFNKKKLIAFNPNTIDSAGFVSLGIKPKTAHSILKYRSKGGKFKTATDFSKIYGISEQQFHELLPYITIPEMEIVVINSDKKKDFEKKEVKQWVIELNSCDTTELQRLKGIGSGFARRIIKYRDILGGYHNKEQLKEVFGFTPEKFEGISSFIIVDTTYIKQIRINKASLEKLKSHPYLNFYSSKAICEQRKKLGNLKSENDLKNLQDLPAETLEKVLPYLSFE